MKFTVLSKPHPGSDMHPIQIDEGEFAGCQLIYGAVSFDETPDGTVPILKFDYDIVNDYNVKESQRSAFQQTIGDILVQILEEFLDKNETIYKGGV